MTWDELYSKCNTTNGSGRHIFTVAVLDISDLIWAYDNAPDYEPLFEPLGESLESIADRIIAKAASMEGGEKFEAPFTEENVYAMLEDAVEFLRDKQ